MIRFLGIMALILGSSMAVLGQQDCVLRKDADSIKVYTCAAEQTKFKTIRASFTINTEFSRLAAYLLDVNNYVRWQFNTIEARVIERVSDQEVIYYTQIQAPWPVSNRDMVTRLRISQDPETRVMIIATRNVNDVEPARKGVIRVPMSQAQWTVTPLSRGRVKVEYVIRVDPGGYVPAWMINMVSAQAPFDSFRNLRSQIGKWRPGAHKLPFVKD